MSNQGVIFVVLVIEYILFYLFNNEINGGLTSTDLGLRNNWLGVYAGQFIATGSFLNVGAGSFYWSSTIGNATFARFLVFDSAGVNPALNNNKAQGNSVRCVQ